MAHIGWVNPLWGAQGIDVFFIISGFISALVSGREARPGAFILARLLRVAPVYWLATLAWNELHPANEVQHLLLSLVFIPHIGPKGMIWPVIEQGWTLLYEAFFYCAFATALMLPQRRALSVLTCVFVLLVAIGRAVRSDSAFSQVFLSPLLIEFLAGVWLHQAWQRGWVEQKAAGIIAVAASLLVFVTLRDWDVGEWRVIAWGIPAFFLVAGGLSMERVLPRLRWLLLVGDASYAIYLTHRFVIGPLMTVSYSLPTPAAVAAVVIGCAAFGIVVHLSIEKPIANLIRRYSDRHFRSAQALLINTSPTLPRAAAPVEIE